MTARPPCFFFDYVDPLAYLVEREISSLEEEVAAAERGLPGPRASGAPPLVRRVPLELRPPPEPLLDPDAPEGRDRWALAADEARRLGIRLAEPPLVPWTRKAHELVLHAAARGRGGSAHRLIFEAVFTRGMDVGRVDVLVALAGEIGLDATEAKAVLDVDRHAAEVAEGRALASRAGVAASPALVLDGVTLRGFHNRDSLRTFLLR
jgi:2-hydroxychromene-2-carboxylate isomerase